MKPELLASILHNPKVLSLDEANLGLDITALYKRVLVIHQDNLIYEYDGSL
ncbi:MAG TPA: ABC transporter, partial [Richelia sp.]|nr:ABC transporter [Richelia sp.]